MLELLHAVITSLLLSTAMGGGVDQAGQTDEEPANSETGVDVGKLPSHLASPRNTSTNKSDQSEEHHPASLPEQVSFCEPTVVAELCIESVLQLPDAVSFLTAGRSP